MSKNYRNWNPYQPFVLPPSPTDWLDNGHLVYFILDVVGTFDIASIEQKYQCKDARGVQPFPPRMMVALLVYGYCTGIRSSRKLEKATYDSVPFRVLIGGNNHPDHTVISEFRRKNLKEIESLFVQVLVLCQEAGLVKLGHVSLDGTKLDANASKHKAMSYERLQKKEAELALEVKVMMAEAEQADDGEDTKYGKDKRGDELPEELRRRENRLEKIKDAKARLEVGAAAARARELEQVAQDKEKAAHERESSKDAQHAEDVINKGKGADKKAIEARDKAEKMKKLAELRAQEVALPTPDMAPYNPSEFPENDVPHDAEGTAKPKAQYNFTDPDSRIMKRDGGFRQAFNGQIAVDDTAQIIVANGVTNQAADAEHLQPIVGKIKTHLGQMPAKMSMDAGYYSDSNVTFCGKTGIDVYIATGRAKHGKDSETALSVKESEVRVTMRTKVSNPEGKAIYSRRKAIVEPVFGQIMTQQNGRGFLLRGISKVRQEWSLLCMGHNLLKLFTAQKALATA